MYNVLVNGASGRMGNEVISTLSNFPNFNLVCGFDREENFNLRFSDLF